MATIFKNVENIDKNRMKSVFKKNRIKMPKHRTINEKKDIGKITGIIKIPDGFEKLPFLEI